MPGVMEDQCEALADTNELVDMVYLGGKEDLKG